MKLSRTFQSRQAAVGIGIGIAVVGALANCKGRTPFESTIRTSFAYIRSYTSLPVSPTKKNINANMPLSILPPLTSLRIGHPVTLPPNTKNTLPTTTKTLPFHLPPGLYTPHQIIHLSTASLLDVVVYHLGPNPPGSLMTTREQLVDNLASNLALDTRESSVVIPRDKDAGRKELAVQAERVGRRLVDIVRELEKTQGEKYQGEDGWEVRSPCEGYLWKPEVAALLCGGRSKRELMQVFNEWLHQMALLRDATVVVGNWEDAIVRVDGSGGGSNEAAGRLGKQIKRGIRFTEETRSKFLTEMATKSITQKTVVRTAMGLLAPGLLDREETANAYGFQYGNGLVLPSFVAGGSELRLLRYIPAVIDAEKEEVVFQYERSDYYAAKRVAITGGVGLEGYETKKSGDESPMEASWVSSPVEGQPGSRYLHLTLAKQDGSVARVDLGQISRGRRYAYSSSTNHGASLSANMQEVRFHSAWDILTQHGDALVTADEGVHVVDVSGNVELLAVLGKLYPENVVVLDRGEPLEKAFGAGKGLADGGKFVVRVLGEEKSVMPFREGGALFKQ